MPQFLLIGMDCSWARRRWSFPINHLSWTPHPSRVLSHICLTYLQFSLNNCSWQINQVLESFIWPSVTILVFSKCIQKGIQTKKKKKRARACLCRLAFPKSIFKLLKDATLLENSYIWGEWILEGIFLLEGFFGNSWISRKVNMPFSHEIIIM